MSINEEYEKALETRDALQMELFSCESSILKLELSSKINSLDDIIDSMEDKIFNSDLEVRCPKCDSSDMVTHDCEETQQFCDCNLGSKEFYTCFKCETDFVVEEDEDLMLDQREIDEIIKKHLGTSTPPTIFKNCQHVHEKVEFPNGTVVYATAGNSASLNTVIPDFGLYADPGWVRVCTWRNEIINWPDFSLPAVYDVALQQIEDALARAEDGDVINVGCIGAHGRTGTILAIMLLLSEGGQMLPSDCCEWIRSNYCEWAVEGHEQEWFIEYAGNYFYDFDLDPKPHAPLSISLDVDPENDSTCLPIEHRVMMDLKLDHCVIDDHCKWWPQDLVAHKEGTLADQYSSDSAIYLECWNLYKKLLEGGNG